MRTRSIPQDGESFFKTYPCRSSLASSSSLFRAQRSIASVWSAPERGAINRRLLPTPSSRRISRGAPRPISISGHTGTHSTNWPNVSVKNASCLCPPSKRTDSPRRQLLIPRRMLFPSGPSRATRRVFIADHRAAASLPPTRFPAACRRRRTDARDRARTSTGGRRARRDRRRRSGGSCCRRPFLHTPRIRATRARAPSSPRPAEAADPADGRKGGGGRRLRPPLSRIECSRIEEPARPFLPIALHRQHARAPAGEPFLFFPCQR